MARQGDWVRIHKVVLKASERTAKIPEDTQKCDFEMWTKGTLLDSEADIGDEVTVETAVGRKERGILLEKNPYYTHSYGKFVPELIMIDKHLRKLMERVTKGGEN